MTPLKVRPVLIAGRSYAFTVLLQEILDALGPVAADAIGFAVTVYLADTPNGAAIDASLVFAAAEQNVTPAGYSGREYRGVIVGDVTAPFLLPRDGDSVFVCRTANGEPIGCTEYEVAAA